MRIPQSVVKFHSSVVRLQTPGRKKHLIFSDRSAFLFQRNGYQFVTFARQLVQKKKEPFAQILSLVSSCGGLAGEMFSYLLWPIMVCFILLSPCSMTDFLKGRAVRHHFCTIQWMNRTLKKWGLAGKLSVF